MKRASASLRFASPRHNTLSIAEPRAKAVPEAQSELPHIERAPIERRRTTIMRAFSAYEQAQARARKLAGRPGAFAAKVAVKDAMTARLRAECGR